MIDPRAVVALEAPEPCSACGRAPSHYRERRAQTTTPVRRLCRACHDAAVRREQRAAPPLPAVIDPGALRRVAASVGRCAFCGLEPAAWAGGGVRLCDACYRREVRRHGGTVRVVSTPGEGSTFFFTLPAA